MTRPESQDSNTAEISDSGDSMFSSAKPSNIETGGESVSMLSLDELFGQLKQECKNLKEKQDKSSTSNIQSIQKHILNIPKLYSKLDNLDDLKHQNERSILKITDNINTEIASSSKKSNEVASNWFKMNTPEMTPEVKRDMLIIKHRSALDPKRHYKKENWKIPKEFQLGTIIEGNTEFYSSRLSKAQRGKTLVEEILNDDERKKFFKRKYGQIQVSKTSGGKAYYKKVKSMRKKF